MFQAIIFDLSALEDPSVSVCTFVEVDQVNPAVSPSVLALLYKNLPLVPPLIALVPTVNDAEPTDPV